MSEDQPNIEAPIDNRRAFMLQPPPAFPSYIGLDDPRRRYHPIIETETDADDEGEIEFCHYTYRCDDVEGANEGAAALVSLLDDGWAIEDKIVAAPFVTVIFSRVAGED